MHKFNQLPTKILDSVLYTLVLIPMDCDDEIIYGKQQCPFDRCKIDSYR